MYYKEGGQVDPWLKYLKEKFFTIIESKHDDGDHGWGTVLRQKMFRSACEFMNTDPHIANNIFSVGANSIFQSNYVELKGGLLEDIKVDPDLLSKQEKFIQTYIECDSRYKQSAFVTSGSYGVQFGGQRAPEKMWIQLLEIHNWSTDYYATWEVAFNELTWTVRSTNIIAEAEIEKNGTITIHNRFEDTLDLRPSETRSPEYNAACYILGFLYHDLLGGSDELKTKAKWTTVIQPR